MAPVEKIKKRTRGTRGGVRLKHWKRKQKLVMNLISNSYSLPSLSHKWKEGVYVYIDEVFSTSCIENKMHDMLHSNKMKKQNGVKHKYDGLGVPKLSGSYNLGVVRQVGIPGTRVDTFNKNVSKVETDLGLLVDLIAVHCLSALGVLFKDWRDNYMRLYNEQCAGIPCLKTNNQNLPWNGFRLILSMHQNFTKMQLIVLVFLAA